MRWRKGEQELKSPGGCQGIHGPRDASERGWESWGWRKNSLACLLLQNTDRIGDFYAGLSA